MSKAVDRAAAQVYRGIWHGLVKWFKVPDEPPTLPTSPGEQLDRFKPVSASKIAILEVSNASSIVWPSVTLDSVETRATNSFSPTSDSAASSASCAACAPAPSVLKCTYLSAPSNSTKSTLTSKVSGVR